MTETRWLDDEQQQAWRALLVFMNRGFPEIERTFKKYGLLGVHYAVLTALSESSNRTLRLSQLADIANLSQSRLTHRMRTLTERGFVAIEPDPDDGRAKNATLTDEGFRFLEVIAPLHVEDVRRLVFDHLSAAETKALARGLSNVASNLCDHEHFRHDLAGSDHLE